MSRPSIFITGAASGIGKETALLFASDGWRVGLCDLDAARLTPLRDQIGEAASPHAADVADHAALRAAIVAFSGGEAAPLDALFNCAGILDMRAFAETPLERLHAIVDVNVKGVINGFKAALPNLTAAAAPRAVTMCSTSALHGVPDLAVYSASKFAVRSLTEALNIEWQAHGVWVSDVLVGYVRTPMVLEADAKAKSVEIAGVHIEPRQVAQTVWQAVTGEKRVHWFVTPADEDFARAIDATPWEDRHRIVRQISGY